MPSVKPDELEYPLKLIPIGQKTLINKRKEFTKKSVKNREELNKATYRQKLKDND